MATVADNINLGVCGAGNALGFNTDKGCADLFKAAHSIWLMPPSAYFDPTQELDLDYIKTLQKAGSLIVIKGITQFQEVGSDNAVETLEDDTQETTNLGKYKFQATFKKGFYFQRALGSVEGFGSWRTIIVDKNGDILLTQREEGGAKGFTTGEIIRGKMQFPTNTSSLKQDLMWQLMERYEVDDQYVILKNANLAFDPRNIEPVAQVYLSLTTTPGDTDTAISVKAVVDRGRKDAVSGALFGQFLNKVGGATSNPTAGDDSATSGTYVLTIAAVSANDKGEISLYDSSNNTSVVDIAGFGLAKSNTVSYTVAS